MDDEQGVPPFQETSIFQVMATLRIPHATGAGGRSLATPVRHLVSDHRKAPRSMPGFIMVYHDLSSCIPFKHVPYFAR